MNKPVSDAAVRSYLVDALRLKAQQWGLSRDDLTNICLDVAGSTFGDVSEAGCRLVLNQIVSKGEDATKAWAKELDEALPRVNPRWIRL